MDIQLIADYGVYFYLLVFVWTFFEGETIVLFAGFAAAQGLLDPLLLLVCAGLGSYLGDQCYFWLGRQLRRASARPFSGLAPRRRERTLLAGAVRCLVHPVVPLYLRRAEFLVLRARAQRGSLGAVSAPELSARRWCGPPVLSRSDISSATPSALPCNIANWLGYALLGVFVALGCGIWLLHRRHRRHARRNAQAGRRQTDAAAGLSAEASARAPAA